MSAKEGRGQKSNGAPLQSLTTSHDYIHGFLPALFFYTDKQGKLTYCGGQGLAEFGYQQNAWTGHSIFDLLISDPIMKENINKALNGLFIREMYHANDRTFEACLNPIISHNGNIDGLAGMLYDVTEWHKIEVRLRERMRYDTLTGIGNRLMLTEMLTQTIRCKDTNYLSLFKVGVKHLNDAHSLFGPAYKDSLLKQIAIRLNDTFRQGITITRTQDDVFSIIATGNSKQDIILNTIDKIKEVFNSPYHVGNNEIALESNVGASIHPCHGQDAESLIRKAFTALNIARENNQHFKLFSKKYDRHCVNNVMLLAELRNAINKDHLFLQYQPKVDMKTNNVVGLEALIRWKHPEKGIIPPTDFIPLAERTEIISQLTHWVADQAIGQASRLSALGLEIPVAINLSAKYFQNDDIVLKIYQLLKKWNLKNNLLELEITETAVMKNPKKAINICKQIRAMDIPIAIDDFGVGYSPFAYLKDLNVSHLKIDGTFIKSLVKNTNNLSIVSSIIEMSKKLNIVSIAEGIEDRASYELLAQHGCEQGQGFYIAKPMPSDELITWIKSNRSTVLH